MKSSDTIFFIFSPRGRGEEERTLSSRFRRVKKKIIEFDRNLFYGDEFHYRRNNNIDNLEDRESAKGAKERIEKNMKKEGREVKVSTDGKWKKKKKRVISAEGKKRKGRRRNKCPRAVEGS